MNGSSLQDRWPEVPPHTDEDYFAPLGSSDENAERTQPSDVRRSPEKEITLLECSPEAESKSEGADSVAAESEPKGLDGGGESQADKAAAFASECELFADENDGDVIYADIFVNNHRETLRVRSGQFHEWIRFKYYEAYRKSLKTEIVKQAVETIVAHAKYGEAKKSAPVFRRVARVGDRIYLDLCNDRWEAVEVDRDGWQVVAVPDVHFVRARGMLAIPTPVKEGNIEELRDLLNVKTNADFVLMVAWLLHALGGVPPYPLLPLGGEQGAGKSTAADILRSLIDPNKLPLRAMPANEDDLFVSAARSHVAAFDNLSTISPVMSDGLCRLADGSGFGKRTLYSDDDETLVMAANPIILTAIGEVVSRPDLADRSVFAILEVIPETKRKAESGLMAELVRARPSILGALLTALSHGLRMAPEVRLERLPRMADFAKWIAACEGAFWPRGTFLKAYMANRAAAVEAVLEADELACVLRQWLERLDTARCWSGTCTQLLLRLNQHPAGAGVKYRPRDWPRTASSLSNRLRKLAPGLRAIGIETTLGARTADRRTVTFSRVERCDTSASSRSSPSLSDPSVAGNDGDDGNDPVIDDVDRETNERRSVVEEEDGR